MNTRKRTKLIHEGNYAAEVEVALINTEEGWAPYLSYQDAQRLDQVRQALRDRDFTRASQLARIFELTPLTH